MLTLQRPRARQLVAGLPGARDHLVALAGQLGAGVGNLVFALLMARILEPAAFAEIAAFLAIYTLGHLFAGSLSAGAALAPAGADRFRARLAWIGTGVGIVGILARELLAGILGLSPGLVVALAAAAPVAGVLALARGRLYGTSRYGTVAMSLLAEPAVRLSIGVTLALGASVSGAGAGVALAGWAALGVIVIADRRSREHVHHPATDPSWNGGTSWVFLLLAIVMAQDLLLANRLLDDFEAARFAVVSTLGGMAVFASATVPYVLLGRSGTRHALRTALVAAGSLGALATLGVLVSGEDVVGLVFGEHYADVAGMAVGYVAAMALLAIARVLAADLCSRGRERAVLWVAGATAIAQALGIVILTRSAEGIALVTLACTTGLVGALGAVHRRTAPRPTPPIVVDDTRPPRRAAWKAVLERKTRELVASRAVRSVAALTLAGGIVRLLVFRSVWLDEAIAVSQAKLGFVEMIDVLRFQDVHPPLHQTILWVTIRVLGTSEFAVRLPSIIAGTLLIPLLYMAGRDLYGRRTGLIAASLGTVAPFLVWYSQEARMYSFFALFSLAAVIGQYRVIRRGRGVDWVLFGASTALMLWTQYFSIVQIVVQQVVFAIVVWRRWRGREPVRDLLVGWTTTMLVVALSVVPMVGILRDQLIAYGDRGVGLGEVPSQAGSSVQVSQEGLSMYAVAANIVWAVWGYHSDEVMTLIVALWPLAMLFVLWLLGRGGSTPTTFLSILVVGSIGAFVVVGFFRRDLFELRYFAGVVPLLLLFGARALSAARVGRLARAVAVCVVVGALGLGLVDQQINGANPRIYDFRGALGHVSEVARSDDRVLYAPAYLDPVIRYYGSDLQAAPIGDGAVPSQGRVVLVASFLEKRSVSAAVGGMLAELEADRRLVGRSEHRQVRVWVFA